MKYQPSMMRIPARVSGWVDATLAPSGCIFEDPSANAVPQFPEVP